MTPKDLTFCYSGLQVKQSEYVFKIGTDAILLGEWARQTAGSPRTIIDVGTGTGIIAVMLSQRFPDAIIKAIDKNIDAADLATMNFAMNGFRNWDVEHKDIFDHGTGKFSLVVCNPPYFQEKSFVNSLHSPEGKNSDASIAQWAKALKGILEEDGMLYLICPFEITYEWIKALGEERLYCVRRMDVHSREKDINPIRSMICMHTDLVKPKLTRLHLYDEQDNYSDAYRRMTSYEQNNKEESPG